MGFWFLDEEQRKTGLFLRAQEEEFSRHEEKIVDTETMVSRSDPGSPRIQEQFHPFENLSEALAPHAD
jgi:hypothetical protein